jgi:hypothetical protein
VPVKQRLRLQFERRATIESIADRLVFNKKSNLHIVEAFDEPAVDRREKATASLPRALRAPERGCYLYIFIIYLAVDRASEFYCGWGCFENLLISIL